MSKRVGDLVLDDLRRLAGILGVDDHLGVGEIGDGVERHLAQRIEAGAGRRPCRPRSSTRLRADQRMRRAIIGSVSVGLSLSAVKPLQRRLQVAFGIDQEIGGDDDRLASLDALANLDIARRRVRPSFTSRGSKRPSPRSTMTTCRVPLSMTARDGHRDAAASPAPASISTSAYISGLMRCSALASSMRTLPVRVAFSSSCRTKVTVPRTCARERRASVDPRLSADPDHGHVLLRHVGHDPHHAEIRDTEQLLARLAPSPSTDIPLHDDAGDAATASRWTWADFASARISSITAGRDIEVLQAPHSASSSLAGRRPVGERPRDSRPARHHLRAVDAQQRLVLLHMLAGL